jgi:hypothetical protein
MDEVILSRLETEWLVAWFYDRSRQMPPQVQELLMRGDTHLVRRNDNHDGRW